MALRANMSVEKPLTLNSAAVSALSFEGFYSHHWLSHGIPSLSPSILVSGQCSMKYVASAQDVICEQWVRPSHLKDKAFSVAELLPLP